MITTCYQIERSARLGAPFVFVIEMCREGMSVNSRQKGLPSA
ncbi:hypothetical protein SCH4B_3392 [Ruegeria sp. TrichCH4B]|nr:hypothetical protein SCH4B_3392 [Ruegeria sp. TrichCH4B]